MPAEDAVIPGPSLNINIGQVGAAMSDASDLPRLADLVQKHSGWPGVVTGEAHAPNTDKPPGTLVAGHLSMAFSKDEKVGFRALIKVVTLRHERGSSETSLITRSSPTPSPRYEAAAPANNGSFRIECRLDGGKVQGPHIDVGRYRPIPHFCLLKCIAITTVYPTSEHPAKKVARHSCFALSSPSCSGHRSGGNLEASEVTKDGPRATGFYFFAVPCPWRFLAAPRSSAQFPRLLISV